MFETNRYSVSTKQAVRLLTIRALPLRVDILDGEKLLASHPRCYGHEQDVCDPLHYLALLEKRPGALEHAKPIVQWRTQWPAAYTRLLARLRQQWPDGRGVREFVQVLQLHQQHEAALISQAVEQALTIDGATAAAPRPTSVMYLPVGDLVESVRRVQEEGGEVIKVVRGEEGKYMYAAVQDPVGAYLAFVQD